MNIKLDAIIDIELMKSDVDFVFDQVDKTGNVVLIKDNKPTYIIIKYEKSDALQGTTPPGTITLHDAMVEVLKTAPQHQMHATELSDEIYRRGLYFKKNGQQAMSNQIRARSQNYTELFDVIKGSIIVLKKGD